MSLNEPPGLQEFEARFKRSVRDHWGLFLGEGIVLVALGIAAIVVPPLAGLAVTVVIGWLFLIGGVTGLVATVAARQAPGFLYALLSAIVALAAGGLLLWNPLAGVATLTYVLVFFFALDGILVIVIALEHRRELSGRWEWMMVGGAMDLGLAAIIVLGLPGTLAWALGLLVGIDLLFGGTALIGMALSARQEVR
ncbi:MAG TPA: HdeD family acid-resistance protein [Stellaceae bacterium]|nr:HdeD family acid-resistance protein [Stellaceae bacterium]